MSSSEFNNDTVNVEKSNESETDNLMVVAQNETNNSEKLTTNSRLYDVVIPIEETVVVNGSHNVNMVSDVEQATEIGEDNGGIFSNSSLSDSNNMGENNSLPQDTKNDNPVLNLDHLSIDENEVSETSPCNSSRNSYLSTPSSSSTWR